MKIVKIATMLCMTLSLIFASQAQAQPKSINAISGTVGGMWFVGQSAMGKVLTTAFPGLEYNLKAGGSVGNPIRIDSGDGDISLTQKTNSIACTIPSDPYKKKLNNVSSMGVVGDKTYLSIVVRDDFPIFSLEDLAQKKLPVRLAHGPNGTTSQSFGKWALAEYGISFQDIKDWDGKLFSNNYDDVSNMVKDGQIDMFFFVGPGEAGWILDASMGAKLRFIPIPLEKAQAMEKKYGLTPYMIPATRYNGTLTGGKEVPTVSDTSEFICRTDMPEQDVYDILKASFDGWNDIVLSFPTWKTFTPQAAWQNTGLPLHPGAARYYREFGGMK